MKLIRFQPFQDMVTFPFFAFGHRWFGDSDFPRADAFEDGNKFVIKADLPDIDPKDLVVQVDDGVLTLKGERKSEKEATGNSFHLMERQFGSFTRRFELPSAVDADKITADYDKGVLTIEIPRGKETRPKQIKVH